MASAAAASTLELTLLAVVELDGVLQGDSHHADVYCLVLGNLEIESNGWDRSQC